MSTKKLAVLSVSAAAQVVLMLICLLLPTVKISMLFAASLLNGIMCAAGYKKSQVLVSYSTAGILSMLIVSNRIIPVAYLIFFGAYGIVHYLSIYKGIVIKQTIRFTYLALGMTVFYLLFKGVVSSSQLLHAPYIYFIPVGIIIGYILFQILYEMIIKEFFRHKYLADLIIE